MKPKRIHILGPSAAGISTLGRYLARAMNCVNVDADDVYWEKTDPPYTAKRSVESRRQILEEALRGKSWILSGSAVGWGDFLKSSFTHVVFLHLSQNIRIERLLARERERYGDRILSGGDMEKIHRDFLEWTLRYDVGGMEVRSKILHEQWMRSLSCPVLRLNGILPTAVQGDLVLEFLEKRAPEITINMVKGKEAAPLVESFFESLGRPTRAHPSDLYFIASSGKIIVGTVRYCLEDGTHLLRGMLIAEHARRQGIGKKLLRAFDAHLKKHKIGPIFCLPYQHLESFYGGIGFHRIKSEEAPSFLRERLTLYRENEMPDVILMKRPVS